jgi:hypothetical protein
MKKNIAVAFMLIMSAPALAQVTSIGTSNPAPKGQDLNKIVCEVDQTIGSRLGAHKVCKTVLQWQQMKQEQREHVEGVQRNSNVGKQPGG